MKYNTIIAAGLAAGVSADNWQSWSAAQAPAGSTKCPNTVTQTVVTTADCAAVTSVVYQTTITVQAPSTRTVTVYANGQSAPNFWDSWTYTPAPPAPVAPSSLPYGCVPNVVTATSTAYNTKAGSTTTVTRSTLFVGAAQAPTTTVTVTAQGSSPSAAWQGVGAASGPAPVAGASAGTWSGSSGQGVGSSSGSGGSGVDWSPAQGPQLTQLPNGWKLPVSEQVIGTANAWQWTLPIPTNTKSYAPPVYTQKPDGSWGANSGGWESWSGNGGSGGQGGQGGSGGSGTTTGSGASATSTTGTGAGSMGQNSTTGTGSNTGAVGYNITAGAPGSNVTAPMLSLKEAGCNAAGSRGSWCGGKTIDSNYYEDYFSGNTCTFDLTLSEMTLDMDGTPKTVMAVNGQVPGPIIECNWGDIVSVTVHNNLPDQGTSFHWHGVRQVGSNNEDGVPGLTQCPIAPGQSMTYRFLASSYGTSWYHSHAFSQYGDGAFGPIVFHGPATADYDVDMGPITVQDTWNVTAAEQNNIAIRSGALSTANYLLNGHNTKHDLSGGQHSLWTVEAGKKYLFRFINAAAQNAFSVSLDDHQMQVIAADFVPIVPYTTQWLNFGPGQRYDVVIAMDQPVDSYFLRAVTQTGCPSGSDNTGLGNANGIVAYKGVNTMPYYIPQSTTTKTISDFATCADEPLASLVPHLPLGAGTSDAFAASISTLPVSAPALVTTSDDGTLYKWFLNNGAMNPNFTQPTLESLAQGISLNSSMYSNPIVLNQPNTWVYFVIQNQFFASHPIHLHGHDFSILGQGFGNFDSSQVGTLNFQNPMRRDTAMLTGAVPGPYTDTGHTVIGFQTDNPGAWLMHCHIIWHVDTGLALQWIERPNDIPVSKYVDSTFNSQCAAYASYEAANPSARKPGPESGLKRRTSENGVVRRSGSAKNFLDSKVKRSFGQSPHRHLAY